MSLPANHWYETIETTVVESFLKNIYVKKNMYYPWLIFVCLCVFSVLMFVISLFVRSSKATGRKHGFFFHPKVDGIFWKRNLWPDW